MNWQSQPRASELPIGAVCERCGLSPRTVRYYEELGLLPGVRRRAGGRRVYGPDEIERLRFIQRLQLLGLSLAEIRDLNEVHAIGGSTAVMLARLDDVLARRLADLDARLVELAGLRDQIEKYRGRISSRVASEATGTPGASRKRSGQRPRSAQRGEAERSQQTRYPSATDGYPSATNRSPSATTPSEDVS